ncbi:hypothetical protein OTB20_34715 [Streptomyces sp. H27-H1]|uniref:hypothetical protein n=1 Tax=Streptomyces sp. H27-H1 TaxID=2996461 RepID=UPI00226FE52C|nr:hypothetical protein [Streptomyces sp. H27-H1]MCY0931248.1 hypothetical protein [Streptomyces sp. H27-H1]
MLCESRPLDPQLRRRLPGHANIVALQSRFTLTGDRGRPEDESAVAFVFGGSEADRRTLPRETGMQRAVLDHPDEEGHWYTRLGWFALGSE